MPPTLRSRLQVLTSSNALSQHLMALNTFALLRAREFRAQAPIAPGVVAGAQAKAAAAVQQARARAAVGRTAAMSDALAKQQSAGSAARKRLLAPWGSGALRTPDQIIRSFVARSGTWLRTLRRAEQTSLLIRSAHKTLAGFTDALARLLDLTDAAGLARRGITTRQVQPSRGAAGAVYAVRLSVKRRGVATEVHNFAWALRKSGLFLSVRPDGGLRSIFASTPTHAASAKRDFSWPLALTRTLEAHALPPRPPARRVERASSSLTPTRDGRLTRSSTRRASTSRGTSARAAV